MNGPNQPTQAILLLLLCLSDYLLPASLTGDLGTQPLPYHSSYKVMMCV